MRYVGIATTALGGLILLLAIGVGVRSIPDIVRYLKIRRM